MRPARAPLAIPPTPQTRAKFGSGDVDAEPAGSDHAGGHSAYGARAGAMGPGAVPGKERLAELTDAEHRQLARLSTHAPRHYLLFSRPDYVASDIASTRPGRRCWPLASRSRSCSARSDTRRSTRRRSMYRLTRDT